MVIKKIKKELEKIEDIKDKLKFLEEELKKQKDKEIKKEIQKLIDGLEESLEAKVEDIETRLREISPAETVEPFEVKKYEPVEPEVTRPTREPEQLEEAVRETPVTAEEQGIIYLTDTHDIIYETGASSVTEDPLIRKIGDKLIERKVLNPEAISLTTEEKTNIRNEVRNYLGKSDEEYLNNVVDRVESAVLSWKEDQKDRESFARKYMRKAA
jgi:hypothetical protein